VAVFNPIIPLYLKSINAWRIIDLMAALAFGVFLWRYYDYYGKGYQFENYIASLFPTNVWVIADKTRDFSRILKRPVESDTHPDFTFRHIKTGKIFAVGLDVLEEEPANRDNQLLSFPNVLVTPHIAYNSDGAQKNRSKRLVDLLLKYLANETIDSVV